MDLYSYAHGDPVNQLDPDGRLGRAALTGVGTVVAGSMNLAESFAKAPVLLLERTIMKGILGYENFLYLDYLDKNFQNGFASGGYYYRLTRNATLFGNFLAVLHQIPFLNNFIPGLAGNMNGRANVILGGGINADNLNEAVARDRDTSRDLFRRGVDLDIWGAPYDRGSATDVLFSAFAGNTAQGLEFACQVMDNVAAGGTVYLDLHSGGVMRGSIGSFYLGLNNIGVARAFAEQGPGMGFYNNIQVLSANYSIGIDGVSDLGALFYPLYFAQQSDFSLSFSNDPHNHPRGETVGGWRGNEWNATKAHFFMTGSTPPNFQFQQ
jgi:hypothetical protein